MLNLLGPAEVRDVDQAVNALLDFNKYTEVGEVANLGSVLRADGIAYFDIFPGILLKLLDAKRHLALVAVEGEDYGLYLVAYLHEVLSAAEVLAPRHFAYVDKTLYAGGDFNKRTVVGHNHYAAVDLVANLEL